MIQLILQLSNEWFNYILIGIMIIFILIFTLTNQSQRSRGMIVEKPPIKTELICLECGLKEVRDFKEGDYVSKITEEKCKKCGKPLKINLIYSIEIKKRRRPI